MCRFDRVGRSRNLHKGPHKREYFGKGIIFNENQHANYDMINNFQQSRRQRCRSFKKAKLGRGSGGGGASTRTRVVSPDRSLIPSKPFILYATIQNMATPDELLT